MSTIQKEQKTPMFPVLIQEYSQTVTALTDLNKRYAGVIYDLSTPDGVRAAKEARAEIKGYRVDLEKTRVTIKADALEQCRMIDSEAKKIKEALEALEYPIDQQIKAEEKRKEEERNAAKLVEMERVRCIQQRIIDLRNQPALMVAKSSAEIRSALAIILALEITDDQYAEFIDHAHAAKAETITALIKLADDAERKAEQVRMEEEQRAKEQAKMQAERAELARMRQEAEAKMQAEREASEKYEADRQRAMSEENARRAEELAENQRREVALRQAEVALKAMQAQLEQEKLDAEKLAKDEAERIKQERAENEAKMKEMEDEIAVLMAEIASGGLSVEDALRCAYVAGGNSERLRYHA